MSGKAWSTGQDEGKAQDTISLVENPSIGLTDTDSGGSGFTAAAGDRRGHGEETAERGARVDGTPEPLKPSHTPPVSRRSAIDVEAHHKRNRNTLIIDTGRDVRGHVTISGEDGGGLTGPENMDGGSSMFSVTNCS